MVNLPNFLKHSCVYYFFNGSQAVSYLEMPLHCLKERSVGPFILTAILKAPVRCFCEV